MHIDSDELKGRTQASWKTLLGQGQARDALRVLLRSLPECFDRPGDDIDDAEAGQVYFGLCMCYTLLGMEPDATEWWTQAERALRSRADRHGMATLRAWRLWLLGMNGRCAQAIELSSHAIHGGSGTPSCRATSIAALAFVAAKLGDLVAAEQMLQAVTDEPLSGIAEPLVALATCETDFRQVLFQLSPLRHAICRLPPGGIDKPTDAALAAQCGKVSAAFGKASLLAAQWPIMQEFATAGACASTLLQQQLLGKTPSLQPLEQHLAGLTAKGLAPLQRHVRYWLALLNVHAQRPGTAESWLANGAPIRHLAQTSSDIDELLLASHSRERAGDYNAALACYRAYIEHYNRHLGFGSPFQSGACDWRQLLRAPDGGWMPLSDFGRRRQGAAGTMPVPLSGEAGESGHAAVDHIASVVRDIVERDLTRPLSVSDIVEALGISRRTLEIRLRRSTGITVKRFVTNIRVQHARRLIEGFPGVNSTVLRGITAQVGFPSYRTFAAAYQAAHGRIASPRGRPRRG